MTAIQIYVGGFAASVKLQQRLDTGRAYEIRRRDTKLIYALRLFNSLSG